MYNRNVNKYIEKSNCVFNYYYFDFVDEIVQLKRLALFCPFKNCQLYTEN